MSKRMDVARAYEQALFAGRMDEVGGYFTDDISYWVAGRPPIGGAWQGRDRVLRGVTHREAGRRAAESAGHDAIYEAADRAGLPAQQNRKSAGLRCRQRSSTGAACSAQA